MSNILFTIGACMLATPFIAFFIAVWRQEGFLIAISVFGLAAFLLSWVGAAVYLMGDLS